MPKDTQPIEGSRRSTRLSKTSLAATKAIENLTSPAPSKRARTTPKTDSKEAPSTKLANIDIGEEVPSLELKNQLEQDVNVQEEFRKGAVVFLVPKADTPGCTNQACAFRDAYAGFQTTGYSVYCLSADKPAAQERWKTKKELPYNLISDPKRELISALGAGAGGKTARSHFIFEKGTGKLIEKKIPVKAADSSKLALQFLHTR